MFQVVTSGLLGPMSSPQLDLLCKALLRNPLPGTTYAGPQLAVGLNQNLVVELLRNQQEMFAPEPSSRKAW